MGNSGRAVGWLLAWLGLAVTIPVSLLVMWFLFFSKVTDGNAVADAACNFFSAAMREGGDGRIVCYYSCSFLRIPDGGCRPKTRLNIKKVGPARACRLVATQPSRLPPLLRSAAMPANVTPQTHRWPTEADRQSALMLPESSVSPCFA